MRESWWTDSMGHSRGIPYMTLLTAASVLLSAALLVQNCQQANTIRLQQQQLRALSLAPKLRIIGPPIIKGYFLGNVSAHGGQEGGASFDLTTELSFTVVNTGESRVGFHKLGTA